MPILEDPPIFTVLAQLRADWPNRSWSWDSRLSTVTSSFAVALAGQARAVATRALPRQFDAATIASSPAALLAIVERSGGLRGDQLAFCSGDGTPVAFALWWPWGGGDNISLRIGVVGVADAEQRLGQLFGVDG